MAKKQKIEELGETSIPNSRSKEKVDHEKALKLLDETKKNRKGIARLAKQGEGEFSRGLKFLEKKEDISDLYNVKEAADYLGLTYGTFSTRTRNCNIPCKKVKGKRYFSQDQLDLHQENFNSN